MSDSNKTEGREPVGSSELLGRRIDPDISALKACVKALNRSSSPRMLKENLDFLYDRYLLHPSPTLPEHLRPNYKVSDPATPK